VSSFYLFLSPSGGQQPYHYLLGRLYNQQKRTEEAEQEFKKFHELDKNPANREFPITDR